MERRGPVGMKACRAAPFLYMYMTTASQQERGSGFRRFSMRQQNSMVGCSCVQERWDSGSLLGGGDVDGATHKAAKMAVGMVRRFLDEFTNKIDNGRF